MGDWQADRQEGGGEHWQCGVGDPGKYYLFQGPAPGADGGPAVVRPPQVPPGGAAAEAAPAWTCVKAGANPSGGRNRGRDEGLHSEQAGPLELHHWVGGAPQWCETHSRWVRPALCLALLWFLWSAGSLLVPRPPRQDYGMVIDAGSHGSRVNLFAWDTREFDVYHPGIGPISIPRLLSIKMYAPGIDKFAQDPQSGKQQLAEMLSDAQQSLRDLGIAPSLWPEIPLYLKATAGMRVLDQKPRDAVMSLIRAEMRLPAVNPFRFTDDFARVISGEEEGVYGWVAVNNARHTLVGADPSESVGALDMGGASTEITFSPFHTSILEDFNSLHLGKSRVRLYSHSFLRYGWDDALSRVSTVLAAEGILAAGSSRGLPRNLEQQPAQRPTPLSRLTAKRQHLDLKLPHPCFPKGHSFKFELPPLDSSGLHLYVDLTPDTLRSLLKAEGYPADFVEKVVAEFADNRVKKSRERPPATEDPTELARGGDETHAEQQRRSPDTQTSHMPSPGVKVKIKFLGSGDFALCYERATRLFMNLPCFINGCSFNGVYQPRLMHSRFVAFGQYSSVWEALELPPTPTLTAWKAATAAICSLDSAQLAAYRSKYNITSFSENGINKLCWKSTWCFSVLSDGFGFPLESNQISFQTEDIGGATTPSFGWALGSMLVDVNFYHWVMPDRMDIPFYLLGAGAILLAVAIVGLCRTLHSVQGRFECAKTKAADLGGDFGGPPHLASRSTPDL